MNNAGAIATAAATSDMASGLLFARLIRGGNMTREWQFDLQHSSISFMVRHLLVAKVRGRFNRWSGTMQFDENDLSASWVDVQIDASSVDTSDAQRDAHLRSADFLDVAKHPHMTFKSTHVEAAGSGAYTVKGDLTIRGVTRPIVMHVRHGGAMRDPWGNERTGFSAQTTIDRKEFGITFNQVLDHGGLALGEHIAVEIDVEATNVAAAAAS
jgi:polyisoprenoid-binding protein YceI